MVDLVRRSMFTVHAEMLEDLEKDVTFAELIEAMRTGNAYTNVHTKKYVMGEICGQVKPIPSGVSFLNN